MASPRRFTPRNSTPPKENEMRNILEELWYGNICPDSYFGQTSA